MPMSCASADVSGTTDTGRAPKDALSGATLAFAFNGQQVQADAILRGERCDVFIDADHFIIERIDPLAHVGEAASDRGRDIHTLMPGRVVALLGSSSSAWVQRVARYWSRGGRDGEHREHAAVSRCEAFERGRRRTGQREGTELVGCEPGLSQDPVSGNSNAPAGACGQPRQILARVQIGNESGIAWSAMHTRVPGSRSIRSRTPWPGALASTRARANFIEHHGIAACALDFRYQHMTAVPGSRRLP